MNKRFYYSAGILCSFFLFLVMASSFNNQADDNNLVPVNDSGFVLMELFTSQGCSSCPLADEILGEYARKNNNRIIPIAFHVDYWNRLGWIDSFSNAAYSQRQRDYGEKFSLGSIYTPQLVINGKKQLVGSDGNRIAVIVNEMLGESAAVKIKMMTVAVEENTVQVKYEINTLLSNSTINAGLIQKNSKTSVRGGENRGAKLNNYNVVRDFKSKALSGVTGIFSMQLPPGAVASDYMIVLFLQDKTTGIIKAAAKGNCN